MIDKGKPPKAQTILCSICEKEIIGKNNKIWIRGWVSSDCCQGCFDKINKIPVDLGYYTIKSKTNKFHRVLDCEFDKKRILKK